MYQPLTHSVHALQIELVLGLDWHKAHVVAGDGFGDRLRIQIVVLVRLAERLHKLPGNQPHLMPLTANNPGQTVRTAACLHADQRACQLGGVNQKRLARELPADDNAAVFVKRD